MCGYQCDEAVNKNDTREVIWYHFTEGNDIISLHGSELSNQIDCDDLVGPIGLHVIFWLMPGVKFWEEELLWPEELFSSFINDFLYFNLVAWCFGGEM